jgi:hypothetical protein
MRWLMAKQLCVAGGSQAAAGIVVTVIEAAQHERRPRFEERLARDM